MFFHNLKQFVWNAFLVVSIIAVFVIGFAALTQDPPAPYVRTVGTTPDAPVARYRCEDGKQWLVYTSHDGSVHGPYDTGRAC